MLRFQFAGRLALLATAIGMGASFVRVGFEDSPFFAPGKSAKSNTELVERIVSLIHQIGYEVVGCDEAREMLGTRKYEGG
jgi:3-keto-5-aminohexanoate cleavage enzyme